MLLALLLLGGVGSTQAQTGPLTLADFDRSGLQVESLALFEAGGATTLYSAAGSRWGANGSLVEGGVDLGADSQIVRVMVPKRNGSLLRLNDNGPLVLREFFGESGAGSDPRSGCSRTAERPASRPAASRPSAATT